MALIIDREWPFYVRAYYANDVEPPKVPGELAIETKHKSDASRAIEVMAAESRSDIGLVEWGYRYEC